MDTAPPPYNEAKSLSSDKTQQWAAWDRKFLSLQFTEQEAGVYAHLFVENEIYPNMISELSDEVLKSMGIEKAGHRIRILRLQMRTNTNPREISPNQASMPVSHVLSCWKHPTIPANEKCRRCKRFVCLSCRREKNINGATRYYCEQCYDECIIL